jgi:hypothetical protein
MVKSPSMMGGFDESRYCRQSFFFVEFLSDIDNRNGGGKGLMGNEGRQRRRGVLRCRETIVSEGSMI